MTMKRILAAMALMLVVVMMLTVFTGAAAAGVDEDKEAFNRKNDKKLAQKEGVSGSLASSDEKEDSGKGPSKLQMAVGVGSIFVMIAVVKWL